MFVLYELWPMGTLQTIPYVLFHVSSPFFFKYSYFLDSVSSDVWSQANINSLCLSFPLRWKYQLYVFYETIKQLSVLKTKFLMLPSSSASLPQSMSGAEDIWKRCQLTFSSISVLFVPITFICPSLWGGTTHF